MLSMLSDRDKKIYKAKVVICDDEIYIGELTLKDESEIKSNTWYITFQVDKKYQPNIKTKSDLSESIATNFTRTFTLNNDELNKADDAILNFCKSEIAAFIKSNKSMELIPINK